jgi:hypothetical protein
METKVTCLTILLYDEQKHANEVLTSTTLNLLCTIIYTALFQQHIRIFYPSLFLSN